MRQGERLLQNRLMSRGLSGGTMQGGSKNKIYPNRAADGSMTVLKSDRGLTLIELMMYAGLTALVVSLFSTVFLWIGSDFRVKIAENKAEMNLLESAFTLRRVLAQARHLEAADNSTGELTNLFFTPQIDASGKIAIGPLDGSNLFDTFNIPNA